MALWIAVGCLALSVVFFGLAIIKYSLAVQVSRNLGGKWTWDVVVDKNGTLYILFHLWPENKQSKEILATARLLNPSMNPDGTSMNFMRVRKGCFSEDCYQVMFADVLTTTAARLAAATGKKKEATISLAGDHV